MSWTLPTCRRSLRLQNTVIVQWSFNDRWCSLDCLVVWKALTYKFVLKNHQYLQSLEWDMIVIVDDISDKKVHYTLVTFVHEMTQKTQHTWQIVFSIRGLDCPEVNPVPVAYQRMNGSWVCAAGYAGSVQAVSCVCGVLNVLCSSGVFVPSFHVVLLFPCEHVNSFFTSQVKVKVSVNIGESPVLLKSNSVIQSVFSVSSPLFWQAAESLNGRVSRRFCCDTGGLLFEQLLLLGAKFAGLQQAGPSRWIESSISSPFGNERSDIRIAISVLHAETNPIFWDSRTNSSRKMMENVPDTSRYIKIHHTESYIIPYVIMTRHNDTSELETGALLSHRARPVCLWHLGLQRLEILYETSRVVKKFHIIS